MRQPNARNSGDRHLWRRLARMPAASYSIVASILAVALLLFALNPERPVSSAVESPPSLTFGSFEQPDSLNPLRTQTDVGRLIDSAVFDSLLRTTPTNTLAPSLAVSWTHSDDGLLWTFHLRPHVHWADGTELTSTDVYWTYITVMNPANAVASTQGWDRVDRMTTPDRLTVVLHLHILTGPWLQQIGTTPILPKHVLFRRTDFTNGPFDVAPFGTGAYRVKSWTQGTSVTLEANPYSWRGAPHYRRLVIRLFADQSHVLSALRAGTVDIAMLNPQQLQYARKFAQTRVIEMSGNTWYHVDLKQWGALREQAVRQALDFDTPKALILRDVAGGHGEAANADLSPLMSQYYEPRVPTHAFDPLRAAELLAWAGFKPDKHGLLWRCRPACEALRITLWSIQGDYYGSHINTLLQQAWRAIGVDVRLSSAPAVTLFGSAGPQFTPTMTAITYAWTNGNDPDDRFYWNSAFIPTSQSAVGGNDVAYFHQFAFQRQIDTLTNRALLQTNAAQRRVTYIKIQKLLADQVPVLFLYWQHQIIALPRALRGYVPNAFAPLLQDAVTWR